MHPSLLDVPLHKIVLLWLARRWAVMSGNIRIVIDAKEYASCVSSLVILECVELPAGKIRSFVSDWAVRIALAASSMEDNVIFGYFPGKEG